VIRSRASLVFDADRVSGPVGQALEPLHVLVQACLSPLLLHFKELILADGAALVHEFDVLHLALGW